MYTYQGTITKYKDGDTVEIDLDLGFKVHFTTTLRLARINAPEVKLDPQRAAIATNKLKELTQGKLVTVRSTGKDKYGRYVAELFVDSRNINDQLLVYGEYESEKGKK